MNEANTHRRLVIIGVLVLALFAGLLTRLWFLQVNGGETLAVAAQAQRDRFVNVPAVRGTIYDDHNNVLAQTVPVTSLVVDRQNLSTSEKAVLVKNLAAILFKSPDDIAKAINNPNYQPFESVPVARKISLEAAIYVTEHRDDFPETSVTRTAEREYPNGSVASDILGYLGQVNGDDLKAHPGDGYQPIDSIGKTGVEQMFESQLRGAPGKDKYEVDNQNRKVNVVEIKKPVAGNDVHLTVDLPTQKIAEESLQQGIDGARTLVSPDSGNYYPANAGAVVVLDARTGAVVAMASNPSFDPNDFITGNSDQYFADKDNSPLINRALNAYAPGSTFKTFTSIAMLQNPSVFPDGPNTTYSDYPDGCFHFGAEGEKRCNAGGAILGTADLPRALTVSSDVYFYNVGNEFWKAYRNEGQSATGNDKDDVAGDKIPDAQHPVGNAIQHTDRTYGFGAATGIGLGDQAGIIPDHEYRVKVNPKDPDNQIWRRGDSASLAVGQGDVLVTPLQLANAYAAFANGGTLYQPRLASSVTQSGQANQVVSSINAIPTRSTQLDPGVRDAIVSGLTGVVHEGGTAAGAFNDYQGIDVIGKTGTAQRSPPFQDTSWFAGITNPQNDPAVGQYVVVAMVEQGGFGASVAAPIVRRVIDFLNNPNAPTPPAPVVVAPAVTTLEQTN